MKWSMKRTSIVGLMSLFAVLFCCCSHKSYPSSYLIGAATILEGFREEWLNLNRPPDYDISRFTKPPGNFFNFTNTISTGGRQYKCLFGAREKDWPQGVLVITEDGIILWIRDRDGQVTLAPEVNGIEL
jgi:hypothetical protein